MCETCLTNARKPLDLRKGGLMENEDTGFEIGEIIPGIPRGYEDKVEG